MGWLSLESMAAAPIWLPERPNGRKLARNSYLSRHLMLLKNFVEGIENLLILPRCRVYDDLNLLKFHYY
jgi:hypothetical protein